MENQTIGDIFANNDKIRGNFKSMVANLTEEQAKMLPEGEKWTLAELVEHVGIVEGTMVQVCTKLLSQAQADNKTADGATIKLSANFKEKAPQISAIKLEAPDFVRPTGTKTIAQSLSKLDENRENLNQLRPLFENFEGSEQTFPHPYFGGLTAHEWLILIGSHEARHIKQITSYLERIQ